MAADDQERTPHADEAWKDRVKAEAAALDEAAAGGPPNAPADQGSTSAQRPQIDASQLPPANLATLVSMLGTQAMVALGVLPNPVTGEPDPQPALARHFIDLIGLVEEKTKENCTIDEQRMLNTTLHELRMAFIELSKPDASRGRP
jgi:hypothetical protein